jgi:cytochrome c biogenesis protein CcmG/thiol:disulfide interchange protein DsbE
LDSESATADRTDAPAPAGPGRVRLLLLLPVVVFLGLAILFAIRLGAGDPARLPSALVGKPAPALALPAIPGLREAGGQAVPGLAAADLRGGRVTVLNVWASWCAPCRLEHPLLMDLAKDPSIRLVGLNYKDSEANARRFLGAFGNPFAAIGADDTGRTAIDWGVYGVPETFVVGPDGVIRYKHVGPLTPESLPGFLDQVRQAARPAGGS